MEDLIREILRHRRPDGAPLPSVRTLARQFDRSPQTVQKVLRVLKDRGLIHTLPRKGGYWGATSPKPVFPQEPVDRSTKARERLLADLRCGVYHPYQDLPPLRSLAQLYGVPPSRLGPILEGFVATGILEHRGRSYGLAQPRSAQSRGTILLVSRCDAQGRLLFDSERETDFMKSVHREGRERNLRILVAGWNEAGGGRFLDQQGRELDPSALPGVFLGTIVSTWLVQDPDLLLERLHPLRQPISVWWEHPGRDFPSPRRYRPSTVGFNLSFGPTPGLTVGRHLRSREFRRIAFVSPFHASEWSRSRLAGLVEGLQDGEATVEAFTNDEFESAWHYRQAAGNDAAGAEMLRREVRRAIERMRATEFPCWVAVNDHVAWIVLEELREQGRPRPYLVSFDNSSICDTYQIDAFEFHTEGMVRQMIYHILQPKARLFQGGGLHEMVGRLVLRS